MKQLFVLAFATLTIGITSCNQNRQQQQESGQVMWPEITAEMKPWTRWWWHGSAVTEKGLTDALEAYEKAGLGGVEITPIYGVRGEEDQFIDFLSDEWTDKLIYTLDEAERLGLGVDLANASGWPFGGPWVDSTNSSKYVASRVFRVGGGEHISETVEFIQKPVLRMQDGKKLSIDEAKQYVQAGADRQEYAFDQLRFEKPLPLLLVAAYRADEKGYTERIDLTDQVADGRLEWTAPTGDWIICALYEGLHGKQVERAGPGGEGNVIDHFTPEAVGQYLAQFDAAFQDRDLHHLRYYFNDSYEVDDASGEANWTPDFLEMFQEMNGYDLRDYLPALLGEDTEDLNNRVLYDYRMTISELLLENYTKPWQQWAAAQGKGIRNQAHGSPANVLDLYAASDVPEIEGREIVNLKSAPSAAHVTGKKLVSSESATWLNEHFESNWGDVKNALDKLFLSGVNHVFYHGTAYSPQEAAWPGWLFYAAVHFTPSNSLWGDFKALNTYVARTQSFLQAGRPANDVLLYFNVADLWSDRGNTLLKHFHSNTLFDAMSLHACGSYLSENGYSWDAISDKQLAAVTVEGRQLRTGGNIYKTIVVPPSKLMPTETFERLLQLAETGATVLFVDSLPLAAPGMGAVIHGEGELDSLKATLQFTTEGDKQVASYGVGKVVVSDALEALVDFAAVEPEALYKQGLQTIRRLKDDGNYYYFIKNSTPDTFEGWVTLQADYASAALYNPMTGSAGYAQTKVDGQDRAVYLQLRPNESILVETYKGTYSGDSYPFYEAGDSAVPLRHWEISFVKGGPTLPDPRMLDSLGSWTQYGDAYADFSGTATYTTLIPALQDKADAWLLRLDSVHESAAVYLHDSCVGTMLQPPYELEIPADALQENDTLKIAVSNLMANRIAYMERQGLTWQKFYNINMSARRPENKSQEGYFSARAWQPKPSGLIGQARLVPLQRK